MKIINNFTFLIIVMIVMLFAVLSGNHILAAQKGVPGIIIITDTKNPGVAEKADEITYYASVIRECNGIKKGNTLVRYSPKTLPIQIFDFGDKNQAQICKTYFKIKRNQLPFVMLAQFNPSDLSVQDFYNKPESSLSSVKCPKKAAEYIMKNLAGKFSLMNFVSSPKASFSIKSEPEGAEVLIDGDSQGLADGHNIPLEAETEHQLTLKKDGYLDYNEKIELNYGQEVSAEQTLEPAFGRLEVNVSPKDASIKVDDGELVKACVKIEKCSSDCHRVFAALEKHRPVGTVIRVRGGKTTRKTYDLSPYKVFVRITGHKYYEKGTAYNPILRCDSPYVIDLEIDKSELKKSIDYLFFMDKYHIAENLNKADVIIDYEVWPRNKEELMTIGKMTVSNAETGVRILGPIEKKVPNRFSINSEGCLENASWIFKNELYKSINEPVEKYFIDKAKQESYDYLSSVSEEKKPEKREEIDLGSEGLEIKKEVKNYLLYLSSLNEKKTRRCFSSSYCQLITSVLAQENGISENEAEKILQKDLKKYLKIERDILCSRLAISPSRLPFVKIRIVGEKDNNRLIELVGSRGKTLIVEISQEERHWKISPPVIMAFDTSDRKIREEIIIEDARNYLACISSSDTDGFMECLSENFIQMMTKIKMMKKGITENEAIKLVREDMEKLASERAKFISEKLSVSVKDLPYLTISVTKVGNAEAVVGLVSARNQSGVLQMVREEKQWKVIPTNTIIFD